MTARPDSQRLQADARDAQLALAAQAGRREAFGDLVEIYQQRLFRFLRMRSVSHEDAEELLQEAMLRAWNRIQRFDAERSFSTWLFTLAARLAVSYGRKGRVDCVEDAGQVLASTAADGLSPAEVCERSDAAQNVWDVALQVLRPEARSVLWLYYGEQRSTPEIAIIIGKREDAVRARLARARNALSCYFDAATLGPQASVQESSKRVAAR